MTADDVLWEFTEEDDEDLGYTFGTPLIARLYDGTWAAIFGNGYSSANGKAVLYVVDLATGDLIKKIDTEVGDTGSPNGLSGTVYYYSTSSSGSTTTTYAGNVYAGDLQGNLWKFDLSASNSNSWDVAFVESNVKYPLFSARNDDGEEQPITSSPEIKALDEGGYMILFGTGKYVSSSDVSDLSVQSVYGIRDTGERIEETDRSTLLEQEIYYEGTSNGWAVRAVTDHEPDWEGDDADEGWYLDLVSPVNGEEGERVVQTPELWFERLGVATLIPSDDPCDPGTYSWYMELDYRTGGTLSYTVFDTNDDNAFDEGDYVDTGLDLDGDGVHDSVPVSGIGSTGVGNMPAKVGDNLVMSEDEVVGYDLGLDDAQGRLSWRERR
jgi:type IV pilus assembly protein PilY1